MFNRIVGMEGAIFDKTPEMFDYLMDRGIGVIEGIKVLDAIDSNNHSLGEQREFEKLTSLYDGYSDILLGLLLEVAHNGQWGYLVLFELVSNKIDIMLEHYGIEIEDSLDDKMILGMLFTFMQKYDYTD
jgi:hypothetical protein